MTTFPVTNLATLQTALSDAVGGDHGRVSI